MLLWIQLVTLRMKMAPLPYALSWPLSWRVAEATTALRLTSCFSLLLSASTLICSFSQVLLAILPSSVTSLKGTYIHAGSALTAMHCF